VAKLQFIRIKTELFDIGRRMTTSFDENNICDRGQTLQIEAKKVK